MRSEFSDFIATLARYEPVHLFVHDADVEADARARLGDAAVRYHRVSLDDVWFRDCGPLFVTRPDGAVSFVNWEFNAWGQKFSWNLDNLVPEAIAEILQVDHFEAPLVMEGGSLEHNGAGVFLTTRQCLLSPTRNSSLMEIDLMDALRDYLGASEVLWLDRGLEGDHTDGHIDTIARFVGPRTVVCCVAEDPDDANYAPMQENLATLRAFPQGFEVVALPLPAARLRSADGERLPPSYANFYVANGCVLVPIYGDVNDGRALEILRPLFPDREVLGCMSREIIHGGGSFHCLTQQQPAGPLWREERAW